MRVFLLRLQSHQVDDVDHADLEVGGVLAKEVDGRQRLDRWHVTCAGHDDVRLAALVVARPFPDADAGSAVLYCGVHVEPLWLGLLSGDNDVDEVATAQAVISHR